MDISNIEKNYYMLPELRNLVIELNNELRLGFEEERLSYYLPVKPNPKKKSKVNNTQSIIDSILHKIKTNYVQGDEVQLYGLFVRSLIDYHTKYQQGYSKDSKIIKSVILPYLLIRKNNYFRLVREGKQENKVFIGNISSDIDFKLSHYHISFLVYLKLRASGFTHIEIKKSFISFIKKYFLGELRVFDIDSCALSADKKTAADINSFTQDLNRDGFLEDFNLNIPSTSTFNTYFSKGLKKSGSFFSFNHSRTGFNQEKLTRLQLFVQENYPDRIWNQINEEFTKFSVAPVDYFS